MIIFLNVMVARSADLDYDYLIVLK